MEKVNSEKTEPDKEGMADLGDGKGGCLDDRRRACTKYNIV